MGHLKELPAGTIWPHLLTAIEHDVIQELRQHAATRADAVRRAAETPETAAMLQDKFAEGIAKALHIVGLDSRVQAEADRMVREIDPNFDAHRQARWTAERS